MSAGVTADGEAAKAVERRLEALYAQLSGIDCQRRCARHCGPIVMAQPEWERIADRHGERVATGDLACPYLAREEQACTVHPLRPLICRLWGVVETMPCPYGCEPERMLTQEQAAALIDELLELSAHRVRSVWPGWEQMLAAAPDAAAAHAPLLAGGEAPSVPASRSTAPRSD